jgi:DNA mismatch endonuclease, patch repair protein
VTPHPGSSPATTVSPRRARLAARSIDLALSDAIADSGICRGLPSIAYDAARGCRLGTPSAGLTTATRTCFAYVGMALSRSEQMARIRGKDTSPERRLRFALWKAGLRYRLHRHVEGARPDLVFLRERVAVFIDGCFWHGCPDHYVRPRSRDDFWATKLARNTSRDREQTGALEARGWRVCRIWEHVIFEDLDQAIREIQAAVRDSTWVPRQSWRINRADIVRTKESAIEHVRQHLVPLRGELPVEARVIPRHTRKWARRTQISSKPLRTA